MAVPPSTSTQGHWTRDRLSLALLEVAESIAAYRWDLSQIRELLLTESAAMKPEVATSARPTRSTRPRQSGAQVDEPML